MMFINYYPLHQEAVQIIIKLGSYAEVRKGIHKVLGITRAIKIITKSEASSEEVTRVL